MKGKFSIAVFLALVTSASVVEAAVNSGEAEAKESMFRLGGFGTLGVSHSNQSQGDYVLDSTIPKGAGRSSRWATGNDTRIGVQLSADFSPEVAAVIQVISEYQPDNTYRPVIEWANFKYAFSPNAYVRAGRIALPTFINSDSRKVGYSYPWIHPPVDLYRQLSITNSDGVDGTYRFDIGEVGNSIKAIYGSNSLRRPTSVSNSSGMWGLFDTVEYGPLMLRLGYQERVSTSLSLVTGLTGVPLRNSDLSIGASYDPGNWFAVTEWMQRKGTAKIGAMYVSAGLRVDALTPYVTYSQNSKGAFLPGFPPPTAAAIRTNNRTQSTMSLGARWDFRENLDLKLQLDRVKLGDNSNGYLTNVPVGVMLGGTSFHVMSAVIDFVF